MNTNADKTPLQENEPVLQLKKPLVPIDEYAARKGISRSVLEKWGKLGIVQIRRYKGETFVVDTPFSQYPYASETAAEPAQLADKAAHAEKISELAEDVVPEPLEITNNLAEMVNEIYHTESPSEPTRTPDLKTPEAVDEPAGFIDETAQTEEAPESVQTLLDQQFPMDVLLAAQARAKLVWQTVAISSMALVFAALCVNLWLYMDRKAQLDRLNQAYASVQQFVNDSAQASQRAGTLQSELADSRTQIRTLEGRLADSTMQVARLESELNISTMKLERLQSQLDDSTVELKTVRDQLAQARQDFETIKKRNAEAVRRLNAQIRKFSGQPPEPMGNP
jgi:hypothetical protein